MKKTYLLFFYCILFAPIVYADISIPKVSEGKPLPSDLFIKLNKAVNPAVVNISTETKPQVYQRRGRRGQITGDPLEELLRQMLGQQAGRRDIYRPPPKHSLGTGFIIRKDGLIITNSHVVNKADIINIQLSEKDEKTYQATVIGVDPKTDIALIKIKTGKELPVVKLGTSANLQVGEWVAAFGNPFGHGHSMSKGIVSAIGRDLDEINLLPFIQTDASINPGNSGGPLVNVKGEVIGVNTAIDARAQGIGFAIPIDEVKNVISQLEKTGSVSRGFLGVEMRTMSPLIAENLRVTQTEGAIIINVLPSSAAARAGIKPYDIITKLDGKTIKSSSDLIKYVSRLPIGKTVRLHALREGKLKKLKVTIGNSNTGPTSKKVKKPLSLNKTPEKKSSLFTKFGFSASDLTSKIRKQYELRGTGKHKAYVSRLLGYSVASQAGLREGDVIYEINRRPVFSAKGVGKVLSSKKKSYLLRIKRGKAFSLIRLEI